MVKVCDCFPEVMMTTEARQARYRAHPEESVRRDPVSVATALTVARPRAARAA